MGPRSTSAGRLLLTVNQNAALPKIIVTNADADRPPEPLPQMWRVAPTSKGSFADPIRAYGVEWSEVEKKCALMWVLGKMHEMDVLLFLGNGEIQEAYRWEEEKRKWIKLKVVFIWKRGNNPLCGQRVILKPRSFAYNGLVFDIWPDSSFKL